MTASQGSQPKPLGDLLRCVMTAIQARESGDESSKEVIEKLVKDEGPKSVRASFAAHPKF
jgi:hypothetical protein